jgi:FKBP-type peptidyl-prolyl cis-trans isomerase
MARSWRRSLLLLTLACSSVALADEAPSATSGKPVTTASGLQYWELKTGDGPAAASGDIVSIVYKGWLADGTLFDSTGAHGGQPLRFWLGKGNVVKGMDEGVVGMKLHGRRQLHIPAKLGYGAKGAPNIPPNADLVFDVEVVAVAK